MEDVSIFSLFRITCTGTQNTSHNFSSYYTDVFMFAALQNPRSRVLKPEAA